MNDNATNQSVSLNNEATLYAAVLSRAAPAPASADATVASTSTIVPDAHVPPSGKTAHQAIFSSEHE